MPPVVIKVTCDPHSASLVKHPASHVDMAISPGNEPLLPPAVTGKYPGLTSTSSLKRRRNLVKAACNRCRAGKVKCDGKRPLCGRCTRLNDGEQCEYDVDDGETRQDALRKKTTGMQKDLQKAIAFIEDLKSMSSAQVDQTMAKVRAGSDVQAFLHQYHAKGASRSPETVCYDNKTLSRRDARPLELFGGATVLQQYLTVEAVQSFFERSGKLFHVFSREEIQFHSEEIYQASTSSPSRLAMASVFSVCAVGCAYLPKSPGREVETRFFDLAKVHLDDAIEASPVKAAKICCMLGMRLLFQKHRASLTFIEMGLELCRKIGADSQIKPFDQTEAEWIDGRKLWRTLVFFASWLSSSVGYLSNSKSWWEAIGHQDVNIRGETSLEDLVQTAMVKVSLLKFSILRFNLDGNPLTSLSLRAMSKDLQRWYEELPAQVHLQNIQDSSVSTALRRTVYFCHLLYLGCIILLARRVIHSNLSQANPESIPRRDILPDSEVFVNNAVVAAQQSARILSLLQQEHGIFKRCWLCIFQSYVALTMNLFALATNLLAQQFEKVDELSKSAAECLEILDICQLEDPVAARFYKACQPTFVMLNEFRNHRIPEANLQREIDRLLEMFCVPFGDTGGVQIPVIRTWRECESADTTLHGYSLVVCREQSFEACQPFDRKIVNMAPSTQVKSLLESLGSSRFLRAPAGDIWPDALQQR